MPEISISTKALEEEIKQLKTLKNDFSKDDISCPEIVGGGQAVGELETIANLYKKLNADMVELLSNTISFMENVKNSYISSDSKAASSISEK